MLGSSVVDGDWTCSKAVTSMARLARLPTLAGPCAGGHPGAIVSTSGRLGTTPSRGPNLVSHEHEFLGHIIPAELER